MTDVADDVKAEVAPPTHADAPAVELASRPAPARRLSGFGGTVLGGVIAAGLGFGLSQYLGPLWGGDAAGSAALTALQAEVEALKSAPSPVAGVEGRVATLEEALAALAPSPDLSPDLAAIAARLTALESRPATASGLAPADAALLTALTDKVAALEAKGVAPAEVEAAKVALKSELDAALAAATALQADADARASAAASTAARMQLAAALESGAPYAAVLPALGDGLPEALTRHADAGVPSLVALRDGFPGAARAALDAARKADLGATWSERALNFLKTQVGARSLTAQDGDDPDAMLSRAEAALTAGDLAAALSELDRLPETARGAFADWRAKADVRMAAFEALRALEGGQ